MKSSLDHFFVGKAAEHGLWKKEEGQPCIEHLWQQRVSLKCLLRYDRVKGMVPERSGDAETCKQTKTQNIQSEATHDYRIKESLRNPVMSLIIFSMTLNSLKEVA